MSRLRSVEEIPAPYNAVFNAYPSFNRIQSTVFDDLFYSLSSIVVTAPTGSGKTALFEIALVKFLLDQGERRTFKAVYIAPVKALCNERYNDWTDRFGALGINCIEVTGDSLDDPDLRDSQVILTTPEKWDSITRRWRDRSSLVPTVKLLMIDEIHLLRDDKRGPVLESIVCRMKTMMRLNKSEGAVRFIGVSATIFNIEDLAAWLGNNNEPAVSHRFGNESRPVALTRIVKGFPQGRGQNAFLYDIHLSYKLKPLILNHAEGKPVLIFCSTRRGVTQTCKVLSENLSFKFASEHKNELGQSCGQFTDMKLRDLVVSGVGYHHAGMVTVDRKLVQDLFMKGLLPVLVATSTLAMGVNLPAHLVIIKSTQQFVAGRVEEYPESTVLQMVGRAGRPQFDTTATAVILTKPEMVSRYERLLDCKEVLESSLHLHLAEYLNAEIVLLTIGDLSIAMEWLRCTFLYQRAIRNPKYYGLGPIGGNISRIEKALETIVLREINALKKAELVEMNDNGMDISPTANGKIMSYYYVSFLTFKLFVDVAATSTLRDILLILCSSNEMAEVQLRANERRSLNELNVCKSKETIRYPMEGKISTRSMKVNCLVQACLGCIIIPDPSLYQEALRAVSVLNRVAKCLTDYLRRKNWYIAYVSSLTLTKCLHARLWENSFYVSRQLERIGPTLSSILVGCGKTSFQALEESSPQELERILNKGPPFGSILLDKVRHLPQYDIDVRIDRQNVAQNVLLSITISIENIVLVANCNTAGPYHSVTVVVGDTSNRLIHSRQVPDSTLIKNPLQFDLKLHSPLPQSVFISVISNQWVGFDVVEVVTVNPFAEATVCINSHVSYKANANKTQKKAAKKKNPVDARQKLEMPSWTIAQVEKLDENDEMMNTLSEIILTQNCPEYSPLPLSQASYLRALNDCRNITFDVLPSAFEDLIDIKDTIINSNAKSSVQSNLLIVPGTAHQVGPYFGNEFGETSNSYQANLPQCNSNNPSGQNVPYTSTREATDQRIDEQENINFHLEDIGFNAADNFPKLESQFGCTSTIQKSLAKDYATMSVCDDFERKMAEGIVYHLNNNLIENNHILDGGFCNNDYMGFGNPTSKINEKFIDNSYDFSKYLPRHTNRTADVGVSADPKLGSYIVKEVITTELKPINGDNAACPRSQSSRIADLNVRSDATLNSKFKLNTSQANSAAPSSGKRVAGNFSVIQPCLNYLAACSPQRNLLEGYRPMADKEQNGQCNISSLLAVTSTTQTSLKSNYGRLPESYKFPGTTLAHKFPKRKAVSYSVQQEAKSADGNPNNESFASGYGLEASNSSIEMSTLSKKSREEAFGKEQGCQTTSVTDEMVAETLHLNLGTTSNEGQQSQSVDYSVLQTFSPCPDNRNGNPSNDFAIGRHYQEDPDATFNGCQAFCNENIENGDIGVWKVCDILGNSADFVEMEDGYQQNKKSTRRTDLNGSADFDFGDMEKQTHVNPPVDIRSNGSENVEGRWGRQIPSPSQLSDSNELIPSYLHKSPTPVTPESVYEENPGINSAISIQENFINSPGLSLRQNGNLYSPYQSPTDVELRTSLFPCPNEAFSSELISRYFKGEKPTNAVGENNYTDYLPPSDGYSPITSKEVETSRKLSETEFVTNFCVESNNDEGNRAKPNKGKELCEQSEFAANFFQAIAKTSQQEEPSFPLLFHVDSHRKIVNDNLRPSPFRDNSGQEENAVSPINATPEPTPLCYPSKLFDESKENRVPSYASLSALLAAARASKSVTCSFGRATQK